MDMLAVEEIQWAGRQDEVAFLSRIWDLTGMPSTDYRFADAAGDIFQHRINNPEDWPDDWVFNDSRFDLAHTDDDQFLTFLCQTVHPLVRADADEAQRLVALYNDYLRKDGVHLVAVDRLGRSGARLHPHPDA
jgi:AbiJ N-terminal domain 3